jgi:hypothetical protein
MKPLELPSTSIRAGAGKTPSSAIRAMKVATLLMLILPACSWGADFQNLLSGKTHPLTVKLGSLQSDWRRFTIHTAGCASGNISVSVSGHSGPSSSSQNNVADLTGSKHYLTQGKTVAAAGQLYLVAYRLPGSGLDLSGLIQAVATKAPPTPVLLTPETTLPLSLLDVKSLGILDDIRAFDLKREIAESEKLAQTIANALKSAGGGDKKNAEPPAQDKQAK